MSVNIFFNEKSVDPDEIKQLKEFDNLYYNEGTSPISDEEYDAIKDRAKDLYPNNSYFFEVGFNVSGSKVSLPFILGSLKKVKTDSVEDWIEKGKEYIISEKLDGVSLYIEYNRGQVVFAATRGNGYEGKDITKKAKIFCPKIKEKSNVSFRGEALLKGDFYKTIDYKTRRNGVAGILNRDDDKFCEKISPVFYEVIYDRNNVFYSLNEVEKLTKMYQMGLGIPNSVYNFCDKGSEYLIETLKQFKMVASDNGYEIDGLVIKPLVYERENVYYPEGMIAFKVNDLPIPVDVLGVEWNVSRTGRLKPIVNIKPTIIGGVTISRATGFNAEFVKLNGIGKGSVIEIQRSGDVIPHIVNIVKKTDPCIIEKCPSCYSDVSWKGVDIVCSNEDCVESVYKKIAYFLRKMGVENITEVTIRKLELTNIEDCYKITELDIASFDGFGINKGEQITNEIKKTLVNTPDKFIAALGISGVSDVIAKSIVDYYRGINTDDYMVMDDIFNTDEFSLTSIDGIGEIIAENFVNEIKKYEGLLNFLYDMGLKWKTNVVTSITGKIFTLTGKGTFTRQEYHSIITNNGGIVKGMSKNTHYLVAADTKTDSSKAKKARQYGVLIITYEDLINMLKE